MESQKIKFTNKLTEAVLRLGDNTRVEIAFGEKIMTEVISEEFDMGYLEFQCVCTTPILIDIYRAVNKAVLSIIDINDTYLFEYIFPFLYPKNTKDYIKLIYYRCPICGIQYLVIYSTEGDAGRIHFSTTIHSVWQIEVDEAYFLQFFNKPLY